LNIDFFLIWELYQLYLAKCRTSGKEIARVLTQ
jgi:hypothetical protein